MCTGDGMLLAALIVYAASNVQSFNDWSVAIRAERTTDPRTHQLGFKTKCTETNDKKIPAVGPSHTGSHTDGTGCLRKHG